MRILAIILLQLITCAVYGQSDIIFKEPLKVIATEKINAEIKKDAVLSVIKSSYSLSSSGYYSFIIVAKNEDGKVTSFEAKKITSFEFKELDNTNKVWDAYLLKNGTYATLLTKGLQADLRNELNNEAIDYVNTLSSQNRFFDDAYLEDYLYTILNKIHSGILTDRRPGNLFIKIVKDTEPNAFALPNGCIVVSTGLLSAIQSEDELIGVLAHEVAHFALDHHVANYNKEIDRKKRAEFWAGLATGIAAGADAYLAASNRNHIPGLLTASVAIAASAFSDAIASRLGIKYNQDQELEADNAAKEILDVLKYDSLGLSAALYRIKNHCVVTGNYLALSGSGTHPSLDSRINALGKVDNLDKFTQPAFLKKVSSVNSYNAWIELWHFAHHFVANDLANRNISNDVATESDYIVKGAVKRRLSNTKESNEEVISLLNKAKSLNVTPYILLHKEEGITYIRLGKKTEAKKAFQTYLELLHELNKGVNNGELEDEISWTKTMIFKADNL